MSRPPKPVRVLNQAMREPSVPAGLQQIWRVALEEGDEQRAGKPDDVQVVAVDPLDETAAQSLDRVRTGAPLPLPALEVRRRPSPARAAECHVGDLVADESWSGPSRQRPETTVWFGRRARAASARRRRVGRLAVERPSRTTAVSTPSVTRPSVCTERAFPFCVRADELGRLEPRRVVLDVGGARPRTGSELLEDRPPLRRGRREDERSLILGSSARARRCTAAEVVAVFASQSSKRSVPSGDSCETSSPAPSAPSSSRVTTTSRRTRPATAPPQCEPRRSSARFAHGLRPRGRSADEVVVRPALGTGRIQGHVVVAGPCLDADRRRVPGPTPAAPRIDHRARRGRSGRAGGPTRCC